MKLDEYTKNMNARDFERFCGDAGTNVVYMKQLLSGFREAGIQVAVGIELASGGKVTLEDLRPDVYRHARKSMRRERKRRYTLS